MKKNQEGSAMILVLCVLTVTTALCLALLLGTSVSMKNVMRAKNKEQCRVNAVSVSDVLIDEIKSFRYEDTVTEGTVGGNPNRNLKDRLQTINISTNNENVEYTYFLEDETVLPGKTLVKFYWTNENPDGEDCPSEQYPEEVASWFEGILLHMEVTAVVEGEKSTIISCFQPKVSLSDEEEEITSDEEEKTWSSWTWEYVGHDWEEGGLE